MKLDEYELPRPEDFCVGVFVDADGRKCSLAWIESFAVGYGWSADYPALYQTWKAEALKVVGKGYKNLNVPELNDLIVDGRKLARIMERTFVKLGYEVT